MSEIDLCAFHAGDHELFERLVEEMSPRLLAVASRYTSDRDGMHDIVQNVWMRAYERRGQLASGASIYGWLFSICHREALSARRSETMRSEAPPHDLPAPGALTAPDDWAERAEVRSELMDAFADLPPRERDAVELRLVQGLSTKQAAQRMECAEGTVKAALHHARQKLQPLLRRLR